MAGFQAHKKAQTTEPEAYGRMTDASTIHNYVWHWTADKRKVHARLTWNDFKKEMKKQFYLKKTEFEAYDKLRRLRHTGSLQEYVKEYWETILELLDMADREALYNTRASTS
ncbi:hypothetical protein RJ640_028946 [Escallonia rubra]|uniref:Retrotransposon gag domain-containing protein n=1 Tax=Escallonia rubra TaxID=112253 RepID=A0AA88R7G6_9ASTE|nr:hypothetical protein RJ640_002876 [Escallonia rubra]KAK2991671.1 hypothetical protein RJ640_028946 [Escallonia rubra]